MKDVGTLLDPGRQPRATEYYRRYVQHIMDIAVCLQGLHYSKLAQKMFNLIRSEVQPFYMTGSDAVPEGGKRSTRALREWAARLACSCSLRLMDSWSGEVYTWCQAETKPASLDNVVYEYGKAVRELDYYSGNVSDDFARNICTLKGHIARTRYMNGLFDEAHVLLDGAIASVYAENGTMDRMAFAVCELRRAECLMLEADAACSDLELNPGMTRGVARNRLDLARTSLEHARQILSAEPGHVWRWSLLFLEQTQLIHEEVLFTYFASDANSQDANIAREQLIQRGLSTISAGLDNIEKDRRRWKHLEILWWQFYLCFLFDREQSSVTTWLDWGHRNQSAGLQWFLDQQKEHSYSRKQILIDACLDETYERKRNCGNDDSLRKIMVAFQRQVFSSVPPEENGHKS